MIFKQYDQALFQVLHKAAKCETMPEEERKHVVTIKMPFPGSAQRRPAVPQEPYDSQRERSDSESDEDQVRSSEHCQESQNSAPEHTSTRIPTPCEDVAAQDKMQQQPLPYIGRCKTRREQKIFDK